MKAREPTRHTRAPARGSMWLTMVLVVLGLAGITLLVVLLWPWRPDSAPCGPAVPPSGEAPARLLVHSDRGLSFRYVNRVGKSHLAVFAVDSDRDLIWFYPDGESRRQSVPIERSIRPRPLPSPPARAQEGDTLRVHAVFTSGPLEVDAVEALVKNSNNAVEMLPIRGAVQDTVVVPRSRRKAD